MNWLVDFLLQPVTYAHILVGGCFLITLWFSLAIQVIRLRLKLDGSESSE